MTNVHVYLDGKHIGEIEMPCDSVSNCEMNFGLLREIERHTYKVEIMPDLGTGCTEEIEGELHVVEGGYETIFINYFNVEWN